MVEQLKSSIEIGYNLAMNSFKKEAKNEGEKEGSKGGEEEEPEVGD